MTALIDSEQKLQADISARQRTPKESELLVSLYRAFIESRDLDSGLRAVLEIVCRFTGWVVGTAWLPSKDEIQIGLCSSWHADDPKLAEFVGICRQHQFGPGVGILGRVWQRQKDEWTRNLAIEPTDLFPLAPAAANADLKATFALPITHDNHVDAVLIFHAREARDEDERLVEVIFRITTQLSFALQHKRLEEELLQEQALVLRSHATLEEQVEQRSVELSSANQMLQAEVSSARGN